MPRLMLAILLAATAALPQGSSPPEHLRELNVAGEWERAAELAEQFLRDGAARPLADRCYARGWLAFSRTKLGQKAAALAALADFDKECAPLPADNWLRGFAARVRKELAMPPPAPNPMRPPRPPRVSLDKFWQTAAPATLGADAQVLAQHRALCESTGADACLVVRRGKIVQELYSVRYREPMSAMSITKSVVGILVGMLLDEGKLKSVDEPVCAYVKGWCEGRKGKVTIRHLLAMTSGLPDTRTGNVSVGFAGDKNSFAIAMPLAEEPGARWAYSNEGVQLLSPIMDKAAGEPIQDYARKRLFGPLGMLRTRLKKDEVGHAWTYGDMQTTPRDLARIGLLMLRKGTWQGRRVVSAEWVERSTARSQEHERYGLLWWLSDNPKGYIGRGNLETNLYVFPEQELVVVRMQNTPARTQYPYEQSALRLFRRLGGDRSQP